MLLENIIDDKKIIASKDVIIVLLKKNVKSNRKKYLGPLFYEILRNLKTSEINNIYKSAPHICNPRINKLLIK